MGIADDFEHAVMARVHKENLLARPVTDVRDVHIRHTVPSASMLFVGMCIGAIAAKVACVHIQ